MKQRVVILGQGFDALLAAWVFAQHPKCEVRVIGSGPVDKAAWEASGLVPVLTHTSSMANLLSRLDVPHASYSPREGILLRDEIRHFPRALAKLGVETARRVRHDVYVKARRLPYQDSFPLRINNPKASKAPRRLRCAWDELLKRLLEIVRPVVMGDWDIEPHRIVADRVEVPFDRLVVTVPLWSLRPRIFFPLPEVLSTRRSIAFVTPRDPRQFSRWDTVLTPYTPEGAIYRVIAVGSRFACEVSGQLQELPLLGDLGFLFPAGFDLTSITQARGEMHALTHPPTWPNNIAPLGAYAKWDPEATLDTTLDDAYELMRAWL